MGELQFLWWHWVVLGIVLVLLELAVPTFFLVWFGVGAIVVGIALAACTRPAPARRGER